MIGRAALLSVLTAALLAGPGQAQEAADGEGVSPPAKLTEEYPLGGERLCCGSGARVRGPQASSAEAVPPGRSPSVWLFALVPLAVAGSLVAFALYARGAPATAYGYALHVRARPRREVPPWALSLLRPLFEYHFRRDAWVLRGIGNRVGPVLRPRVEIADPIPETPPEPRRTGRFERTGEPRQEEQSEARRG